VGSQSPSYQTTQYVSTRCLSSDLSDEAPDEVTNKDSFADDALSDTGTVFELLCRHSVSSEVVDLIAELLSRERISTRGMGLDFYGVLDLHGREGCAPETLSKAYRSQAFMCHPDRSSEPNASTKFDMCTAAYEVLRDPQSRSAYDALLAVVIAQESRLSHDELLAQKVRRYKARDQGLCTDPLFPVESADGTVESEQLGYYKKLLAKLARSSYNTREENRLLSSELTRVTALNSQYLVALQEYDSAHHSLSQTVQRLEQENRNLHESLYCRGTSPRETAPAVAHGHPVESDELRNSPLAPPLAETSCTQEEHEGEVPRAVSGVASSAWNWGLEKLLSLYGSPQAPDSF
jgi:curved DNA-binding protein CbpA